MQESVAGFISKYIITDPCEDIFPMIRSNKLFSCDKVVVILVEGNNKMSAMIV